MEDSENELKMYGRKTSLATVSYYLGFCVDGLRKIPKNMNQESLC
jgi:hypothetical protein